MSEKTLMTIGLCARARALVCGTELVRDAVRRRRARLVIISRHASENTRKRIKNCCECYGVPLEETDADTAQLGKYIGRVSQTACIAVTDDNFVHAILDSIKCNGR